MYVMMVEKDIKEHHSSVPMEQFSIKKNLHVIGGTMLNVKRLQVIIV